MTQFTKPLRLLLVLMSLSASALAGSEKHVFTGEISDTQCAMNVHSLSRSHEEMIAKHTFGTDAASCARTCVRRGGEWVLRSGDEIYRLKNQAKAEEFAGKRVRVFGSLESKTKMIDDTEIQPLADTKAEHINAPTAHGLVRTFWSN